MILRSIALAVLLIATSITTYAGSTPAHIGGCVTQNGGSSSSTVACTLGASVTSNAGDLAAIWVVANTGITVSSVTNDKGDSCTKLSPIGSGITLTPVYCANTTVGAKTWTATMSGSATLATIIIDTYSGVVLSSPNDVNAGQSQTTPGTGSNAITSGNTASANINDLVVGASVNVLGQAGVGTITAGTGFTTEQTVANTLRSEFKLLAASGATASTFTASSASDSFLTSAMTFIASMQMSKINGYAVLNMEGLNMSKINGYAVLAPAPSSGLLLKGVGP